ncbi:hypothetical protein So717_03800 [Roseobacter cerasinus]|uniref:Uncharacterized protein n=1 Tax=Roseobacter cerasinus TaxID=2602289 RepID=A0A640VLJ5_9RHOB|nr:hypothetical protein So717_03800 [Roseobacter cerasinus]
MYASLHVIEQGLLSFSLYGRHIVGQRGQNVDGHTGPPENCGHQPDGKGGKACEVVEIYYQNAN